MNNKQAINTVKQIKKEEIDAINSNYEANGIEEKLLYVAPYEEFNISVPENDNEAGLMLNDVFVVVKERLDKGNGTNIFYDIYDQDGNKIGETDSSHRIKLDRDLLEDKINEQIKAIEGAGLGVAAIETLNAQGIIETYIEMIGRELVVLSKQDEEEFHKRERSGQGKKYLEQGVEKQTGVKENKKLQKDIENIQAREQLENDVDFKIHKMTRIDDDLFYRNNPDVKTRDAYVVLTDDKKVQIVAEENGKYKPVDGFENSTDESGRTNIARNDDVPMDTKNTYGAIYSKAHSNLRYTVAYGQNGEIDLVEQIGEIRGNKIEEVDRWNSREVKTEHTDFMHINREGSENSKNHTERSFDMNSTNKDASVLRNGGDGSQLDKAEAIKEHSDGKEDLTMEAVAQDESVRANDAYQKIENELKEREIELSSEDKEKIKDDVNKMVESDSIVFCDEVAKEYCDRFEKYKESNEQKNNNKEDRNRLDEAFNRRFNRR